MNFYLLLLLAASNLLLFQAAATFLLGLIAQSQSDIRDKLKRTIFTGLQPARVLFEPTKHDGSRREASSARRRYRRSQQPASNDRRRKRQ